MRSRPDKRTAAPNEAHDDAALIEHIIQGSVDAWHTFVERYSGLIYRVIRRHLPAGDEDDWRTVYVDALEELYKGGLAKYQQRAPLAVWLVVFTRRRALDALRSRYGRIRDPKGLESMGEFEREVFQLHHVERLGIDVIAHLLQWRGHPSGADDIVDAIVTIDKTIDARSLKRLDDEHRARVNGTGTQRLSRYIVDQRVTFEQRSRNMSPDRALLEQEAEETAERVRQLVAQLPDEERQVIEMRFGDGLGAKEIADALDLGGQRRAYTIIDRAIRKLRAMMSSPRTTHAADERVD